MITEYYYLSRTLPPDDGQVMHFGEYLVRENILSAHQILKALDEQRKRRKFIPLLLVELGMMDDHRALKLCTISNEEHKDVLDIMREEGIISQQQSNRIRIARDKSGPPLGQLLVEMGFIDEQTCYENLKLYEAQKQGTAGTTLSAAVQAEP